MVRSKRSQSKVEETRHGRCRCSNQIYRSYTWGADNPAIRQMFAAGSPSRHPDAPRAIAALNWSSGIASRRAGNGTSSIDPFQKSILDFAIDPVQPLFGAFCPFLIRLPHCLELRNSCFGGVKLMRKLERRVERMLMISFGEVRCVVQHAPIVCPALSS
jgi:hypothetical protein